MFVPYNFQDPCLTANLHSGDTVANPICMSQIQGVEIARISEIKAVISSECGIKLSGMLSAPFVVF